MSRRSSFKLAPEAAEGLAAAAGRRGVSVSQLVSRALTNALGAGLDPEVGPLPAGERVVAGRLDEQLAASVAAEAERSGISLSAYVRHALGGYLASDYDAEHEAGMSDDELDADLGDEEELDDDVGAPYDGGIDDYEGPGDEDEDFDEFEPSPLAVSAMLLLGAAYLWWSSNPERPVPA